MKYIPSKKTLQCLNVNANLTSILLVLQIDADLATLYPDLTFNDQLWDDFLNNFQIYFWNRIKDETAKQLYDELCSMDELTTPLGN